MKKPTPDCNRGVKFVRNRVDDHLPYSQRSEEQERDAGKEHGAERDVPVDSHALHHGISEVCVQAHARRQRDRITRERAHQEAAQRRRQTGRCRDSRGRQTGSSCRIDGLTKMRYTAIVMNVVTARQNLRLPALLVPSAANSKCFAPRAQREALTVGFYRAHRRPSTHR